MKKKSEIGMWEKTDLLSSEFRVKLREGESCYARIESERRWSRDLPDGTEEFELRWETVGMVDAYDMGSGSDGCAFHAMFRAYSVLREELERAARQAWELKKEGKC